MSPLADSLNDEGALIIRVHFSKTNTCVFQNIKPLSHLVNFFHFSYTIFMNLCTIQEINSRNLSSTDRQASFFLLFFSWFFLIIWKTLHFENSTWTNLVKTSKTYPITFIIWLILFKWIEMTFHSGGFLVSSGIQSLWYTFNYKNDFPTRRQAILVSFTMRHETTQFAFLYKAKF